MTNWDEPHAGDQNYPAMPPAQGQYGQLPQPQYPQNQPQNYPQQPYPYQQYPQQQYPQAYQPYQGAPYGYPQPQTNPMGVAGFVCGLIGLVLFWFPFVGLVLAVLGIALGGSGISAGKRDGASTGLAVAGLVLGIIALIPGLFWLLFALSI